MKSGQEVVLSVTIDPLLLNVPREQAFWFLANMENESLWHPKVDKLEKVGNEQIGLGTEFVSANNEEGAVKLRLDDFVPCERLGNTIERNDGTITRWSGALSSMPDHKTLLIQTWQILGSKPLNKESVSKNRRDFLDYSEFLNPYLKSGVEKYSKQPTKI